MADTPVNVNGNFDGITISLPKEEGGVSRELKADPAGKPLQVTVTTVNRSVTIPLEGKGWTIIIDEVPQPAQSEPIQEDVYKPVQE